MIDRFIALILNGYAYIRKHPQIVMTLVLIVIVPIAFLVSGQQFLNVAKKNQEDLEKERIGILHDLVVSIVQISGANPDILQREIDELISYNPDIESFTISHDEGDVVRIIASNSKEVIGSEVENPESYRTTHMSPYTSLLTQKIVHGVRYWEGYRLVPLSDGTTYYISTRTSLEAIDNLFADRIVIAYYWLFGILAVVLLLVVRHVRLIDYAYLYNETKKANEMKDLFTNMVAHELRAPLTAMRGYASIIREGNNSPETKSNASKIEDSSNRLLLIVSDLLDVARIHSGKLSVQSTRTNIQSVINSVIEVMQVPAREKNITLDREGVRADVFITGDEKRLFQAFTNLVSNSIKYTKSGRIVIGIEERSDRVEIRVMDTGMGISAENQKNLFAPFFRVENTETEGTVGTGLGMWITKQLIELMRGSIAVESIRGVGTHIVVTLPK